MLRAVGEVDDVVLDDLLRKAEEWAGASRGLGALAAVQELADAVLSGEGASSGYLRERLGLTAEEWHGAGELLAALMCFAAEKGFLDWHARTMVEEG